MDNYKTLLEKKEYDLLLSLTEGECFAQGVFTPFGITVDDAADGVRDGGFGSTDIR